jgi:hypothetical protein
LYGIAAYSGLLDPSTNEQHTMKKNEFNRLKAVHDVVYKSDTYKKVDEIAKYYAENNLKYPSFSTYRGLT